MPDPFIERESAKFITELEVLQEYPEEELAAIIREVGFSCTSCGNCCTTTHNGHVFLLEGDTDRAREICPDSLIPAPFYEVCDRKGNFYVSGYALRAKSDGTCIHLIDNRCSIYHNRFCICRVYPYMLHREPDEKGILSFRQISGLNEHGEYHMWMSHEESLKLARMTILYEKTWLKQMIRFFEAIEKVFQSSGERHIRKVYDNEMKKFRKGEPVVVHVFHKGLFHRYTVTKKDYCGMSIP